MRYRSVASTPKRSKCSIESQRYAFSWCISCVAYQIIRLCFYLIGSSWLPPCKISEHRIGCDQPAISDVHLIRSHKKITFPSVLCDLTFWLNMRLQLVHLRTLTSAGKCNIHSFTSRIWSHHARYTFYASVAIIGLFVDLFVQQNINTQSYETGWSIFIRLEYIQKRYASQVASDLFASVVSS